MPIRFRCPHCERLLGIARRKAGAHIHCPQCGVGVLVPNEDEGTDRTLRDLDDLLGPAPAANGAVAPLPEPAESVLIAQNAPYSAPPRVPASKPAPRPASPRRPTADDPLFEQANFEELLGLTKPDGALDFDDERTKKARPVSGVDALSLDDRPDKIVLTSQKATLLVVAAAVLIVLAFVAGFLIRSNV